MTTSIRLDFSSEQWESRCNTYFKPSLLFQKMLQININWLFIPYIRFITLLLIAMDIAKFFEPNKKVANSQPTKGDGHCVKSVQTRSYFWSVFSRIWTVKNSVFGHFSHSGLEKKSRLSWRYLKENLKHSDYVKMLLHWKPSMENSFYLSQER